MKKIRIGNDIVIKWRVTINGEEVNLEGLDLSLYISTTYQPRREIAFTVAGNEITATYKGTEQKVTGVYRLTLYRNEGENAQSILDACDAFELVSCSCLTTDAAFGSAEVELPIADLGIGVPGLSAYEIAVAEGFEGTQAEWLASLSAASEAAAAECREFTDAAKISEKDRQDKEALRVTAENERAASETARQSAEESRQEGEQGRVTAEQARADAEAARAEEFATFEGKIAAKEDAANKVTSIGADADDNHYPSAKAVWSAIEEKFWYGVEWDLTISDPTCTRIGNMELHRTLPVQSQMRGCLLADDGTVNKYLNPDDWTSEVRDGSQGMVMVELPRYFRKFETEGNKLRVKFSLLPLDGFHEVKKKYVSAYEAAMERSTGKLCSVVNEGADYRGGANDSSWDGTYRSQLGMPVTKIDRNSFRTAARKRGSVNWNIYTYDINKDLYWLYVCEYATLNSQATYTEELTAEGYHQGGLGKGLTTLLNWDKYNSYQPVAKCGLTDYVGNNTTQMALHLENDDASSVSNVNVPRYRGVEHPFGHIWKITDAVNVLISPTEANGGDGTSKVYVCDNPNYFNDSNVDGYKYIGNEARNESYVKRLLLGESGEIVPILCSGAGSSTYYCDYHYTNIPSSASALRMWVLGGAADCGALAGFVFVASHHAPSNALTHFGSRLCFIPTSTN